MCVCGLCLLFFCVFFVFEFDSDVFYVRCEGYLCVWVLLVCELDVVEVSLFVVACGFRLLWLGGLFVF